MIERSRRTLEMYKNIGAKARLLKWILRNLEVHSSNILYAKDNDRFAKARHTIDCLISQMEDQMFKDYPELGHDYINVFYGDLIYVDGKPSFGINEVDDEVMSIAMEIVKGLVNEL